MIGKRKAQPAPWRNAKKDIRRKMLTSMLGKIAPSASVLEFGAFSSPMFEPGEVQVRYADRLSTEALQRSVSDPAKKAAIVPVDYVVGDDFERHIPDKFDLIVANHVVEHVPDVIGWLDKLETLLQPGGHVFLAVPDKNYTFDIMRDPTLTRELVSHFVTKRQKPSAADIVDAAVHRRNIHTGAQVWSGKAQDAIKDRPNVDVAALLAKIDEQFKNGEYIDTHCNVFTEASFKSVFRDLAQMRLGRMTLLHTRPVQSPYNEFSALLTRV